MTDFEITRLCAEAMGWKVDPEIAQNVNYGYALAHSGYDPLNNDAQAMALLKLWPMPTTAAIRNGIMSHTGRWETFDINRAIRECVAKMQQAKKGDAT